MPLPLVTRRLLTAALAAVLAITASCVHDNHADRALAEGRTYSDWLFARDFDKLWTRFSPEMRRTFATAADLAAFADLTVKGLGAPHGRAEEHLETEDSVRVYTRAAGFERAAGRVLVQWTLAPSGMVTGFYLKSEPGAPQ
jgi:hypothetical protein